MSINCISGEGKRCSFCDKDAVAEVKFAETPDKVRLCAQNRDEVFCATSRNKIKQQPNTEE